MENLPLHLHMALNDGHKSLDCSTIFTTPISSNTETFWGIFVPPTSKKPMFDLLSYFLGQDMWKKNFFCSLLWPRKEKEAICKSLAIKKTKSVLNIEDVMEKVRQLLFFLPNNQTFDTKSTATMA